MEHFFATCPRGLEGQLAEELTAAGARRTGAVPGGVGFDAILSNLTYTPPDPILAVGPGHLVAIVNSRYQVWDKTGTPLTAALTLDQFFGSRGPGIGTVRWLILGCYFVGGLFALVHSYLHFRDPLQRQRVRIITIGTPIPGKVPWPTKYRPG